MEPPSNPIFFDNTGKRWKSIIRFGVGLAFLISIAGAVFCVGMLILPVSPLHVLPITYGHGLLPRLPSRQEILTKSKARRARRALAREIRLEKRHRRKRRHTGGAGKRYSTVVGFYVNWDPASYESFRRHVNDLSYVVPQWLRLAPDGKSFQSRWKETTRNINGNIIAPGDDMMEALARKNRLPIVPMLDCVDNGVQHWNRLRKLLQDPDAQESLAEDLRDYLVDQHYAGINVDFEPPRLEEVPQNERGQLRHLVHYALPKFMATLNSVFKPKGLLVTEDVPAPARKGDLNYNLWNYRKLNDANDFVIVMLYDLHSQNGNAGPIAPEQWIEASAESIFEDMDPSKVVLGLGNYCYDWPVKLDKSGEIVRDSSGEIEYDGPAAQVNLASALSTADDAGSQIKMDTDDLNPYFTYVDDSNQCHIVYMLDAVTAYDEVEALKDYQPRGAALWYLGYEDPSIWTFFSENKLSKRLDPMKLSRVVLENEVGSGATPIDEGKGEILEVVSRPEPGRRKLTVDDDGLITSEDFTHYPSPYVINRLGGNDKKKLALTFDDGPDPTYTPDILQVLSKNKVPGTFFLIGENVEKHPDLVKREWALGDEVGNHSFTHPDFPNEPPLRQKLELNATQRAIESLIGHSTSFFRPPYADGADTNPGPGEVQMLQRVQDLGYFTVGMNIDPWDWARPGVNTIIRRVESQVDAGKGNIILMHDGGGDRSETVAALRRLIPALKKQGYHFVTVSGLIGPHAHSELFPPLSQSTEALSGWDGLVFETFYRLLTLLEIIFYLSIVLGVLRILVVTPLAYLEARRSRKITNTGFAPPVTVVIPAHNEERVIRKTVAAVLASDYPDLNVLVVDDGSTDATAEAVRKGFPGESRLRLISKEAGGKASALNAGMAEADTEIVVCLDADTVFRKNTISLLVRHFEDPQVGAVAGNVRVGNRGNPLTLWQSLEYVTSQNFDRRAYALLGCVPVVPGAAGAWRRSAVMRAGGYESDTLAEDTDLTFKLQVLGYKVRTENMALAYTEVPDSLRGLARQRFRWAFGILQSLWKHRKVMFKRRYGAFSMLVMPAMWVYNIFFQAVSPTVDLLAILALLSHRYQLVLLYYAAFFALDLAGSAVAFALDNEGEGDRKLARLTWRRFFYRQFTSFSPIVDFVCLVSLLAHQYTLVIGYYAMFFVMNLLSSEVEDAGRQLSWLFWQRFFYRQFMYYVIIKSLFAAVKGHEVGWGKLQRKATIALPEP